LLVLFLSQTAWSRLLFHDNFNDSSTFDPLDPSSPYMYSFFDPTNTNISNQISHGALTQSVNPYTNTAPQGPSGSSDHVKVLQLLKDPFLPGINQRLQYTTHISVSNYVQHIPFPAAYVTKPEDDIRLGSCGMSSVDLNSMLVSSFFLTNEGIYAYYEREPFLRTPTNVYLAFTQVKRVADREKGDYHHLSIEYNKLQSSLSWYVEGELVLSVDSIGHLSEAEDVVTMQNLGGEPEVVEPEGFSYGFGCLTLLDMNDFHNPSNIGLVKIGDGINPQYLTPSEFYDDASLPGNRLWGQGSDLRLKSIKIENF